MNKEWEQFEASPIEAFHAKLMDEFHELRKTRGTNIVCVLDGKDLNEIIVKAKKYIYDKYKALELDQPVHTTELMDIDTVEGSRAYLEAHGIDVDKEVEKGMKFIKKLIAAKKAQSQFRPSREHHPQYAPVSPTWKQKFEAWRKGLFK